MARWHEMVIWVTVAAAGACGGGTATTGTGERPAPRQSDPDAAATLTVENQGFADVTVYAVSPTGNRIRLGQVSGNSTQLLSLPDYLVRGGEQLRFFADPIGGAQSPVSEELYVAPGESVTLTIPPR
ncbi:MAG TPA: hypothetical protein VEB59_02655 [Gemmatimonadales bacterium]|nr:hypothetical protein [Gemmatimonadales bacterium]